MFSIFYSDVVDLRLPVRHTRCHKCGRPICVADGMKRCPFCRAKLLKGN